MKLITRALLSPLVLGAVGLFVAEAKAGPLLGIFFTGPIAAVLGLSIGLISAILGWTTRTWVGILMAAAAIVAVATLYLSRPADRLQSNIHRVELSTISPPPAQFPRLAANR